MNVSTPSSQNVSTATNEPAVAAELHKASTEAVAKEAAKKTAQAPGDAKKIAHPASTDHLAATSSKSTSMSAAVASAGTLTQTKSGDSGASLNEAFGALISLVAQAPPTSTLGEAFAPDLHAQALPAFFSYSLAPALKGLDKTVALLEMSPALKLDAPAAAHLTQLTKQLRALGLGLAPDGWAAKPNIPELQPNVLAKFSTEVAQAYKMFRDTMVTKKTGTKKASAAIETSAAQEIEIPSPTLVKLEGAVQAISSHATGVDIDALMTLVMMQSSEEEDSELKDQLTEMQASNAQKAALRNVETEMKTQRDAAQSQMQQEFNTLQASGTIPADKTFTDYQAWRQVNWSGGQAQTAADGSVSYTLPVVTLPQPIPDLPASLTAAPAVSAGGQAPLGGPSGVSATTDHSDGVPAWAVTYGLNPTIYAAVQKSYDAITPHEYDTIGAYFTATPTFTKPTSQADIAKNIDAAAAFVTLHPAAGVAGATLADLQPSTDPNSLYAELKLSVALTMVGPAYGPTQEQLGDELKAVNAKIAAKLANAPAAGSPFATQMHSLLQSMTSNMRGGIDAINRAQQDFTKHHETWDGYQLNFDGTGFSGDYYKYNLWNTSKAKETLPIDPTKFAQSPAALDALKYITTVLTNANVESIGAGKGTKGGNFATGTADASGNLVTNGLDKPPFALPGPDGFAKTCADLKAQLALTGSSYANWVTANNVLGPPLSAPDATPPRPAALLFAPMSGGATSTGAAGIGDAGATQTAHANASSVAAGTQSGTLAQLADAISTVDNGLQSLGDMSELKSMVLQSAMDKRSKFFEALSNMLKKTDSTEEAIVSNLK